MLFGSLVELHACLHSYLCFSLLEKLFLSNLDSFSTPHRHLVIYQAFQLPLIAISIASRQLGGSIEISSGSSIASWQLVDRSSFLLAFCWFVPRQILNNCICRHLFCSTPGSTDVSTPLNTSIYRDILTFYIKVHTIRFSLFSISLSTEPSFHLLKLSLSHSKPHSQVFFKLFQVFLFTW